MISKTAIFIVLISFLHFVCAFPSSLADGNKCKKGNGNFPKPGSLCRSYYSCKNWIPKEKVCNGDQHFFPAKGYCVWPEEYPCLEKPKSEECPLPNGKFLKPGTECKMYYDCCNGKPTKKKCEKGTLFDHSRGKCDWPEYVTCPEVTKSKECARPDGNFLKPGTGCKIYYKCRDGISTEKRCPSDQLFDPEAEKCEWPEVYTCVEDPKSKECVRPNGKFLRPRTRCKIYYDCRNGIATEKRCPGDLLFDPTEETCEWPDLYTCVEDVSTTKSTPKISTTDSDEDSSSKEGDSSEEGKSSEEGNSSEENKQSSTKSEIKSTTPIISTASNGEYTESSKDEVTVSSTESSSTVEISSKDISSSSDPEDSSTISEIFTPSSTDKYDITSTTYPGTPEGSSTISEIFTASSTDKYDITSTTYPETPEGSSTISEIFTASSTDKYDITSSYPETPEGSSTISEIFTASSTDKHDTTSTYPETPEGSSTISEIFTASSTDKYDITSTYTEIVTEKTYSEVITEETRSEATDTVENKHDYSTTVTSGLTDSVTSHIFCPKPNGYFPHPYDRHKFIACVGGNPTVMDCPEKLVYDHKKRSCEYDI